ncbi:hypothetical protein ACFWMV_27750 [Streptomyces mutabilis]|uniref:hypothetical protein n=1 Tax=Streptomyces mutabilis TaxID=67332 RepID=UPI00366179C8
MTDHEITPREQDGLIKSSCSSSPPAAGLWRLIVLRPLYLYAMATCRRVGDWGTRTAVEVRVACA